MRHSHSLYIFNQGTIYKYGEKRYKLVCMKACRVPGYEIDGFTRKGEAGNDEKLDNNLRRAFAAVEELALCNDWMLFATLTIDKTKYDRKDLGKIMKDLAQLLRDMRKKYGTRCAYLLVPEQHKDGAWHLHGFFEDLPSEELSEFTLQQHLPYAIRDRLKDGKQLYTMPSYQTKFGFCSFERIENQEAAAYYCTKYITKDSVRMVTELNAHSYYCSQGLKRKEVVAVGDVIGFEPDFENEYCSIKTFDNAEDALQYIDNGEENN